MWKWMGLFLSKNDILKCWGWLSLLNWIVALTLSLLLKLPPRKLEPWLVLWSFFLQRLLCISINLPYGHVWNTVVFHTSSNCSASCYLELLDKLQKQICRTYSWGRSTSYSERLHDFSFTIPRCYKDIYVNSFFPRTARLQNSLPIECFPLTYDLSGFKDRIDRHLLTVSSF